MPRLTLLLELHDPVSSFFLLCLLPEALGVWLC